MVEVASDFFESGTDFAVDGPRANIVRVLHDDGTMALYVHLNWNTIRVVPGQEVRRGEYLADSGNTGFSTGPHLHFVVQRNEGGSLVSVPLQFADATGAPLTVEWIVQNIGGVPMMPANACPPAEPAPGNETR